jgi:hypothetical protein
MGIGVRLRSLWRLKAGVAASVVLAALISVWSVYDISLSPLGLDARSWTMATASSHVVIDAPKSALLDMRQDTYNLQGLSTKGVLLGNVLASAPVRQKIAARANVPVEALRIDAPLSREQPRATGEGSQKSTSDIFKSTDQYRINIQSAPTVPLMDFYVQAPTAESATALAKAATAELKAYLASLAATQRTPREDQVRVVDLGAAPGKVINGGIRWQVPLLSFVLTLGVSFAFVIWLARVRRGWQIAVRFEQANP